MACETVKRVLRIRSVLFVRPLRPTRSLGSAPECVHIIIRYIHIVVYVHNNIIHTGVQIKCSQARQLANSYLDCGPGLRAVGTLRRSCADNTCTRRDKSRRYRIAPDTVGPTRRRQGRRPDTRPA